MRVYLVGTSHVYQRPPPTRRAEATELRAYLVQVARRHGIKAIGEELHPDQFRGRGLERSTCADAAIELGVKHRYCEPSNEERVQLGILKGKGGYAAREQHWLAQLIALDLWPCLFICGASHVGSFSALLTHQRLAPIVVSRNWTSGPVSLARHSRSSSAMIHRAVFEDTPARGSLKELKDRIKERMHGRRERD